MIANAKRAEQDAITAAKQGEADAAKAKWAQEVIKAKKVTEAEQEFEVAQLNAKTEAQNKLAMQLKGEGEAAYKKAITTANNNIELKVNAWKEVNIAYANAMASSNWVPTYYFGGAGGSHPSGGASDLINMIMAKTATTFDVDVNPGIKNSGKK